MYSSLICTADLQVVAIKHARRKQDGAKYPSLETFNQMYNCHGEVAAYLQAEPVEALQYILDDFLLAFNLVDKTADGLALLVSAICQAAAQELPGVSPVHFLSWQNIHIELQKAKAERWKLLD